MNNNIVRIKQLEQQIKDIRNILGREEYVGSCISLNLCVGPRRDQDAGLELQISECLPEIFAAILEALQLQIAVRRTMARNDLADLREYFEKEAK